MNAGLPEPPGLRMCRRQHYTSGESHVFKTMVNSRKSTVLIADAEPVARLGLVRLIDSHHELQVVGEADGLSGARDLCTRLKPDIVILDPSMADGFAFIRDVRRWSARAQVVAFTRLDDVLSVRRAFNAGVCGYVTRLDSVAAVMAVLLAAARGERRVGARVGNALLDRLGKRRAVADETVAGWPRPIGEDHGLIIDPDLSQRAAWCPDEENRAD